MGKKKEKLKNEMPEKKRKTKMKGKSKEKAQGGDFNTFSKLSMKHGLHNKKIPFRERLIEQLKGSRFR